MANKIKQTSPDKIRGNLVKYKLGECLSIQVSENEYFGVVMTGKFNKYYNLTCINFHEKYQPNLEDFLKSQFFGSYIWNESIRQKELCFDQCMIECKYLDSNVLVHSVGTISIENVKSAGYRYKNDVEELFQYFISELNIRQNKYQNILEFAQKNNIPIHKNEYLIDLVDVIN